MIFHFSIVQVHCFFVVEFYCTFPFLIKRYHTMFIVIVFKFGIDGPSGLIVFHGRFTSFILTPLVLYIPSSSVSFSYFILAVPMHSVWENTSA